MRSEIEKELLHKGLSKDDPLKSIIDNIVGRGTVLEINGGVGIVSEYMSSKGFNVTLQDSNRLSFSYRKNVVPNSSVRQWSIDLTHIKLNGPSFDYVVCSKYDVGFASKIAKVAVINKTEKTITYVNDNSGNIVQNTEVNGNPEVDRGLQNEQGPDDSGVIQTESSE